MNSFQLPTQLSAIQNELKKITVDWAQGHEINKNTAKSLRKQAALFHHKHYRTHIPYYRQLCKNAGLDTDQVSYDTILNELMITDDVFKSYPQNLLDETDFAGMNSWVSKISDQTPDFDTSQIETIDQWISELSNRGIHLIYSSGTSGTMSFVPRDNTGWTSLTRMPLLYMPFLLKDRGLIPLSKRLLLKALSKFLEPDKLLDTVYSFGLKDIDGIFCNFSGGNQGIQLVGQELGKVCGKAAFLYDQPMSADAIRAIVRGPQNAEQQKVADDFLQTTVVKKEENTNRILEELAKSVQKRRKVMLFGTPFLIMELCQKIQKENRHFKLKKGSGLVFGGGWKSFDGTRIPESELIKLIAECFGLSTNAIMEGYSMTEINGLMIRCPHNRYHVPPYLEAVIFDRELVPMDGNDLVGPLGFIDPFADSYPGFLITGDTVRLVDEPCPCGRSGPAILTIERTPGREVKGCGGIMAKVNA